MTVESKSSAEIMKPFQHTQQDCGSTQVQVALLTHRIKSLTEHFKTHKKDVHSRYGLQTLVNRRRKLLKYLKRTKLTDYRDLIGKLGLRDSY